MKEGAYPERLTSEEGIADVIRDLELDEWRQTFKGPDEQFAPNLAGCAREVADMRIMELIEGHGSLVDAFYRDEMLRDELVGFEKGSLFLKKLLKD